MRSSGHRREVVVRRTLYELRKARARAHILEGLAAALANIDPMIELIKGSATPAEAKRGLLASPWEPGVVTALLQRVGADMSRPDDLPQNWAWGPTVIACPTRRPRPYWTCACRS